MLAERARVGSACYKQVREQRAPADTHNSSRPKLKVNSVLGRQAGPVSERLAKMTRSAVTQQLAEETQNTATAAAAPYGPPLMIEFGPLVCLRPLRSAMLAHIRAS